MPELTYEFSRKLLEIDKFILDNKGDEISNYHISLSERLDLRLPLHGVDGTQRYHFLMRVYKSSKNLIKITLHLQENDLNYCLLRIDLNPGQHSNPEICDDHVPGQIAKYTGQTLLCDHIHFHVQGYGSADWAVPLKDILPDIGVVDDQNYYTNFASAIMAFSGIISLKTNIVLNNPNRMFV